MFSVNSLNSMTKPIGHYTKRTRTSHLLFERPGCHHSTSKTDVRDRIFKLSSIHASVIDPIPWMQWIHWKFYPFSKYSIVRLCGLKVCLHWRSSLFEGCNSKWIALDINWSFFSSVNEFLGLVYIGRNWKRRRIQMGLQRIQFSVHHTEQRQQLNKNFRVSVNEPSEMKWLLISVTVNQWFCYKVMNSHLLNCKY